jgi:uncharacterized protein with NRDE domain
MQRGWPRGPLRGAVIRRPDDWSQSVEVAIDVCDLPHTITTKDVWSIFSKEGKVANIALLYDEKGRKNGKARVRFWYMLGTDPTSSSYLAFSTDGF